MIDQDSCQSRIVHLDKVLKAKEYDLRAGEVEELCRIFKLLGDPGRLRAVHALSHQEMCVCDLAALLDLSESAMSHQLRYLRNTGMVTNRREGSVLYYRLANDLLGRLLAVSRELHQSEEFSF